MDTGAATTSESRRYRWPRPSEPCDPCLSVLILRFVVRLATTRGHTFERLDLPEPDLDRLGRGSAPTRTGRHVPSHDADGRDLGALADGHVSGYANACAQDDEVLQRGAPGNSGLSNQHTVPSNHHIVANLNEIVDLGTFADHGVADRPAVDGGTGADLDVVLNNHAPDLRNLQVTGCPHQKTEPVLADATARMDNHPVPDQRMRDRRPGPDVAVASDANARPHNHVGRDPCSGSDLGVGSNDSAGINGHSRLEACGGVQMRLRRYRVCAEQRRGPQCVWKQLAG